MGELSTKVRRLRDDLLMFEDSHPPTRQELDALRNRVADLLLRALSDKDHPLTNGLLDLERRCELDEAGKLFRGSAMIRKRADRRPDPLRHFFMPHPGVSDPEARRLWRLQLLLQTASRSPLHASRVADRLLISVDSMRRAAEEAAQASSVAMWGRSEYLQRLAQAVALLESPDPPISFRLEGRMFIHNSGKRIRLSPQEASFLRLLVERAGQAVPRRDLTKIGIRYPTQIKNRLLDKLRKAKLELHISSTPGFYTLPVER